MAKRIPLILLLLFGIGAVVALIFLAARWQDHAYRQGLGQALRGAMSMHEDMLGKLVRDYAFWDETVRYAADPDPDWADDNIGAYIQRSFGISLSIFLGPENEPVYAARDEARVAPDMFAPLIAKLGPMLDATRAGPMDSAQPQVAYVRIEDAVHLVATAPVTVEKATPDSVKRQPRPVLIIARALDQDWLDRLATVLPMSSLNILDAGSEGPLTKPLSDPSGRPVGWLTATTVAPVGAAIGEIAPILAILLAIMAGLSALILAQERRAQRQYESHLMDLVREAERANRAKSVFLAQTSHELRTPLNAIIGFAEVLQRQFNDNSRQAESVQHILSGGRHLLALINEVLDLARIESGGYRLDEGDYDLADLLHESLVLMRLEAENARIRLVLLPFEPAHVTLHVDDRAVRQMLLNLLSNAIRYSRPDSEVGVRVEFGRDGALRILVEDKGIGIAPEELALVRQPFERSSRARQHGVGGMGLGLSIVASLIALHGGRLELASEPGAGTTAVLILPRDRCRVREQAPAA